MSKPSVVEPEAPRPSGAIPLSVPEIRGKEWEYLKECLDTNWVSTAGPFVDRLEGTVASCVGSNFAVATASGTASLHIALLVAGVKPDQEVLVSTLTFVAPANAVRYVGAWPVFIDADPKYWQMDPKQVIEFLDKGCLQRDGTLINRATGRQVTAILPVDILGHPCDVDPILDIASEFGLAVIEDASESLGAKYKGRMVGNLGDVGCLSFNGNKVITCGGGGMFVTDDEQFASRAKYLTTQAKDDSVEYIHDEIGYNYRLTNIQAAMGCAQLEQLSDFLAAKRRIAQTYSTLLGEIPGITLMQQAEWASSTSWLNTVLVDEKEYGMSSRALLSRLRDSGIETRPLWQPLHLSLAHQESHSPACPVAELLWSDALSLPSSVGLNEEEQGRVIDTVQRFSAH